MRLCALLASSAIASSAFTGNFQGNASLYMEKIRSDIMGRDNYSPYFPPMSDRAATADEQYGGHYSDAGTDVYMQIRFFKVQEVAAADGKMTLKVWYRQSWKDTRLAWDPAEYGGVDTIYVPGSNSVGDSGAELWVPDITAYNGYVGITETLDPMYAKVSSDGSVFYSRPGTLDVMCKFSGLVAFPFDKLSCSIEFGGWLLSGAYQGILLDGGGYAFSSQEATAGPSYTEYEIRNVSVDYFFYTYACCASEPWPIVLYTITMQRSAFFYAWLVCFPGVLVTFLSFAVFYSDSGIVDPLGYGSAIIIVTILLNVVLIDMLPVCGELLWIDLFAGVNVIFCFVPLFESALKIMLDQHTGDHFVPTFVATGYNKLVALCKRKKVSVVKKTGAVGTAGVKTEEMEVLARSKYVVESVAGVLYRKAPGATRPDNTPLTTSGEGDEEERMRKLIFFENLFYKIDVDGNHEIDFEEAERLLSFCAMDVDPMERENIFRSYDFVDDGKLNRMEFCTLCMEHLWSTPTHLIEKMVENMELAQNARSACNNSYWVSVGTEMEKKFRLIVPLVYIFALIILFHLDMSDNYKDDASASMFSGLAPNMSLNAFGVGLTVTYIVIIITAVVSTYYLQKKAAQAEKNTEEQQKQASRAVASDVAKRVSSIQLDDDVPATPSVDTVTAVA
jgi:nicotinic acetylcholine receptor